MGDGRYVFGPFVLDPAAGVLRRQGTVIPLGQRALALLAALLDADGQPVGKDELLRRAWPGMVVEEANLSVQIAALRKALGPAPDGRDWIATVPRFGYRLPRLAADAAPEMLRPALAVLPFSNLGGDRQQDYFADGVVEDLIVALSRFRTFAIAGRNSSFAYKGRAVDAREAARQLGVRYVLEGGVRRRGAELRVTAELVDGETGTQLWAEKLDGGAAEVFAFQDRIVEAVVGLVEPGIRKAEVERTRGRSPGDLGTYELYLQALQKFNTARDDDNAAAVALLEQAIARQPDYAAALALAANAVEHRLTLGWPPLTLRDAERCLAWARAAIAAGGDDANVLARAGLAVVLVGGDFEEGLLITGRALALNPHDSVVLVSAAIAFSMTSNYERAVDCANHAIRLNPLNASDAMAILAVICVDMGRYAEALDWANRSLAENPAFDPAHWARVAALALLGRTEEARTALAVLEARVPGLTVARLGFDRLKPRRSLWRGLLLAGMPER
jgi:TolB-like protein/DNA-binding winged helix-turn-helix (wHTH) protein